LRAEIARVRSERRAEIDQLRTELGQLRADMGTIALGIVLATATLTTFLQKMI
jgi:hypothetical protein